MKTILVFKTSVATENEVSKLSQSLNQLINKSGRWNFDLEDCDNIFRVETKSPNAWAIASLFQNLGFQCEELH